MGFCEIDPWSNTKLSSKKTLYERNAFRDSGRSDDPLDRKWLPGLHVAGNENDVMAENLKSFEV
jgi:hypothetical protein